MAKLPFPDVPPGPLHELLEELHALHARAGWPSVRELARGQTFSHTAVHELFTKPAGDRNCLVLMSVVEKLTSLASRVDPEATLDKFDKLWMAATGLREATSRSSSSDELLKEIITELNMLRYQAKLSAARIAELSGLSSSTIHKLLSGRIPFVPTRETLVRVLQAIDAPADQVQRLTRKLEHIRRERGFA